MPINKLTTESTYHSMAFRSHDLMHAMSVIFARQQAGHDPAAIVEYAVSEYRHILQRADELSTEWDKTEEYVRAGDLEGYLLWRKELWEDPASPHAKSRRGTPWSDLVEIYRRNFMTYRTNLT